MFKCTEKEWDTLRSKFSTLEGEGKGQHRKYAPKAFTEQGVYMLATILKSKTATEVTIAIMRTFTRMRQYALEYGNLSKQVHALSQDVQQNREWTKDKLSAVADAIITLEEMILEIKSAKEVENIGFLRDK